MCMCFVYIFIWTKSSCSCWEMISLPLIKHQHCFSARKGEWWVRLRELYNLSLKGHQDFVFSPRTGEFNSVSDPAETCYGWFGEDPGLDWQTRGPGRSGERLSCPFSPVVGTGSVFLLVTAPHPSPHPGLARFDSRKWSSAVIQEAAQRRSQWDPAIKTETVDLYPFRDECGS